METPFLSHFLRKQVYLRDLTLLLDLLLLIFLLMISQRKLNSVTLYYMQILLINFTWSLITWRMHVSFKKILSISDSGAQKKVFYMLYHEYIPWYTYTCYTMNFSHENTFNLFNYNIGTSPLQRVNKIKDLKSLLEVYL